MATRHPYGEWYARNAVPFSELPPSSEKTLSDQPLRLRQRAFGYSQEDLRVLLTPMARDAQEPVGSMGNDLSLAVLSDQAPPLFSYFKQLFAQVTNPPIDPIREEIVMSLATSLGNERNLFDETPEHAHKLLLNQPILLNRELETLRHVVHDVYAARTIDITWPVSRGRRGHREGDRSHLPPGARGDRRRREHHHPVRPAARPAARPRSLAAGASRPCTITWCSRARACAPGSSWSPASRARCTTSRR